MKRIMTTAALVGLFALPVAAQDVSQLAAAAGISPAEAQSMSLTEIAAVKFNRDGGRDDMQTVFGYDEPVAVDQVRHAQLIAAADLSADEARGLTVAELAAGKYNAELRTDDQQIYMSSRGPVKSIPAQFVAAAGVTSAEASGMSLNQLYALKINRESGRDERQN